MIDPLIFPLFYGGCIIGIAVCIFATACTNRKHDAMIERNNQRKADVDAYNATRPKGTPPRPYGPVERLG